MRNYLAEIWRCRYFWLSLIRMDLRHRYRGSVLGLGWSLLHPLAMTIILCMVFHHIFHAEVRYYGPFLLAGLACWNYVFFVIVQGSQCFLDGERYIRQFPSPHAIYPLRVALGAGVHFVIALAVVLVVGWALRGGGSAASVLSLIPTLLLLLVLGWSLAALAGLAHVFFQDTRHLCELGLQVVFYATPIIYEASLLENNRLSWLAKLNPLVPLLALVRMPILEGRAPSLAAYLSTTVVVAAVAILATLALARLERRLIFHL